MWGAVVLSSELIEKGGAVESSTVRSAELIEKGGFYAELYCARF